MYINKSTKIPIGTRCLLDCGKDRRGEARTSDCNVKKVKKDKLHNTPSRKQMVLVKSDQRKPVLSESWHTMYHGHEQQFCF